MRIFEKAFHQTDDISLARDYGNSICDIMTDDLNAILKNVPIFMKMHFQKAQDSAENSVGLARLSIVSIFFTAPALPILFTLANHRYYFLS